MSLDGHYLELSDAWPAQLGYPVDELTGVRFDALIFEEDMAVAHDLFAQLSRTGSVDDAEMRMRDSSGAARGFGWSAVSSGDAPGVLESTKNENSPSMASRPLFTSLASLRALVASVLGRRVVQQRAAVLLALVIG